MRIGATLLSITILALGCSDDPASGTAAASSTADAASSDTSIDMDASVPASPDIGVAADAGSAEPAVVPLQSGTLVETADGMVQGEENGTLRVFRGIPFAQPPIDDLRFRPPAPNIPWSTTFDATDFGPACVQDALIPGTPTSEDCLTLNVWSHLDDRVRPVMVWIHGGGFINGAGSEALYEGSDLASNGDVVVITINYRLGPLGYLALPELQAEAPTGTTGNYGSLDQVQALRWIQTNAAAFGGDPGNVTIFGESAGAFSVCALVGSPLADDLFNKGIVESGGCYAGLSLVEAPFGPSAFDSGELVSESVGCANADDVVACLRDVDADEFRIDPASLGNLREAEMAFNPTMDGYFLTETPYERIRRGDAPNRPMILGSNGNEGAIFTANEVILTRGDLRTRFEGFGLSPQDVQSLMDTYDASSFPLPKAAWDAFFGELLFNCNSYHVAMEAPFPTYAYHLLVAAPLLSSLAGPLHVAELPYVFGNFAALAIVPTLIDLDMRRRVQTAWSSFAYTGVPEHTPPWPDGSTGRHLQWGLVHSTEGEFRGGRCDVLRDVGLVP